MSFEKMSQSGDRWLGWFIDFIPNQLLLAYFEMEESFPNLKEESEGFWVSSRENKVDYPPTGNDWCEIIEQNSYWFRHRNHCILKVVKNFPPDELLYDIGGGNGTVAQFLKLNGIDVAVVEPGRPGAQNAYNKGIRPVFCSSIEDVGFREKSLSAIGLFDVLEHVENETVFLKFLSRKLKTRGKLFITVPALPILWSDEDEYARHRRRYTLNSLKKVLENSGFHVLFERYIFFSLTFPVFLFRALPKLCMIKKHPTLNQEIDVHQTPKGVLGRLLTRVLNIELKFLMSMRFPFGTSCLVVGEVPNTTISMSIWDH